MLATRGAEGTRGGGGERVGKDGRRDEREGGGGETDGIAES